MSSPNVRLPSPPLPAGPRSALVIAATTYQDPELRQLRAPATDALELADVLADPSIGGFHVTSVVDRPSYEVRTAVDEFLTGRKPDDLVLVYVSCHGITDARRRLHFAATDTVRSRLASTGVDSAWVHDLMEQCQARRQILILDCCFSGAFARGAKGDDGLGLDQLTEPGRGRVVLTASNAREYSFETPVSDQASPDSPAPGSVFTAALVAGLKSGSADVDQDGLVTVDEAYAYAYRQVRASGVAQTPQRWLSGGEGHLLLARNPTGRPVVAAVLPGSIRAALDSPLPGVRIGAVEELGNWVSSGDSARRVTATRELEIVADNDIPRVSIAARIALGPAAPASSPSARTSPPQVDATDQPTEDVPAPWTRAQPDATVSTPTPTPPQSLSRKFATLRGHKGLISRGVNAVAFSPNGRVLASGGTKSLFLWDVGSYQRLHSMAAADVYVHGLAFSPDGRTLACGSASALLGKSLTLYDAHTGDKLRVISDGATNPFGFFAVAFSPDGQFLACGMEDVVQVWEIRSGEQVGALDGHSGWVRSVAFSPDGRLLASGGQDNTVRMWSPLTGEPVRQLRARGAAVQSVAFSPDGQVLAACGTDITVRLWDAQTGKRVGNFAARTGRVHSLQALAFSPDGSLLATGSSDETVRLWNMNSGEVDYVLLGASGSVEALAFSPDGRLLASGTSKGVDLWGNPSLASDDPSVVPSDTPRLDALLGDGPT